MNSAWAMLVWVMAVKNSVMLSAEEQPGRQHRRHVAADGQRPTGEHARRPRMTSHHSTHGADHPPEGDHRSRRVGPLDDRRAARERDDGGQHDQRCRCGTMAPARVDDPAHVGAGCGRRPARGRSGGPSARRRGARPRRRRSPRRAPSTVRSGRTPAWPRRAARPGRGAGCAGGSAARTLGAELERVGDRSRSRVRRRLADQQALHLDGQHDGDDDEQHADGDRADGVPPRRRP